MLCCYFCCCVGDIRFLLLCRNFSKRIIFTWAKYKGIINAHTHCLYMCMTFCFSVRRLFNRPFIVHFSVPCFGFICIVIVIAIFVVVVPPLLTITGCWFFPSVVCVCVCARARVYGIDHGRVNITKQKWILTSTGRNCVPSGRLTQCCFFPVFYLCRVQIAQKRREWDDS